MEHYSPLPLMLFLSAIGGAVAASVCLFFGASFLLALLAHCLGGTAIMIATGLLFSRPDYLS